MNRFVKRNFKFVAALGVAGGIALILLVIAMWQYFQVSQANSEANDYRAKIARLGRRRPAPIRENIPAVEQDIVTYTKVAGDMWLKFGHPYRDAANRFLTVLLELKEGDGVLEEARKKFVASYREKVSESNNPGPAYDRFRQDYPRWDAAKNEFTEMVRSITPDSNIDSYSDRIALAALGIPNEVHGNADMMQAFLDNSRQRFAALMPEKVQPSAVGFGLASEVLQNYKPEDYRYLAAHLDIIGDIAKRIAKSPVTSLNGFIVRDAMPPATEKDNWSLASSFKEDGSLKFAHYTFEVTGKLDAIRDLAKKLDEAVKENRVYVVRAISIYTLDEDNARVEAQLHPTARQEKEEVVEQPKRSSRSRRGSKRNSDDSAALVRQQEMEKRKREFEKSLPVQQRTGYGVELVGNNRECRAVFDVDYCIHE